MTPVNRLVFVALLLGALVTAGFLVHDLTAAQPTFGGPALDVVLLVLCVAVAALYIPSGGSS